MTWLSLLYRSVLSEDIALAAVSPEVQIGASKRPPLSRNLDRYPQQVHPRDLFAYFYPCLSRPIRRVGPSRSPCNNDLLNNDSSYLTVLLSSTLRPSSIHSCRRQRRKIFWRICLRRKRVFIDIYTISVLSSARKRCNILAVDQAAPTLRRIIRILRHRHRRRVFSIVYQF